MTRAVSYPAESKLEYSLQALDRIPLPRQTVEVTSRSLSITILIVAVSVLVMFFLPASAGPFSSVNGPATAFRAMRHAIQAHQEMARRGLGSCRLMLAIFGGILFSGWLFWRIGTANHPLVNSVIALRC